MGCGHCGHWSTKNKIIRGRQWKFKIPLWNCHSITIIQQHLNIMWSIYKLLTSDFVNLHVTFVSCVQGFHREPKDQNNPCTMPPNPWGFFVVPMEHKNFNSILPVRISNGIVIQDFMGYLLQVQWLLVWLLQALQSVGSAWVNSNNPSFCPVPTLIAWPVWKTSPRQILGDMYGAQNAGKTSRLVIYWGWIHQNDGERCLEESSEPPSQTYYTTANLKLDGTDSSIQRHGASKQGKKWYFL